MVLDYLASDDVPEDVDLALVADARLRGRPLRPDPSSRPPPARPPGRSPARSVQVRILSTSARASTAFQGKTAADGSCSVSFMVPAFPNGNAAAVIRVTGGQRELRGPVPDQEEMSAELAITVNGEPMRLPAGASVADLLERLARLDAARRRRAQPRDPAEGASTRRRALADGRRVRGRGAGRRRVASAPALPADRRRSGILRAPSGPLAQLVEQETLNL